VHRAVSLAADPRCSRAGYGAPARRAPGAVAVMIFSEIVFDTPWLLPLAIVLPILAVAVIRHAYFTRQQRLERLGSLEVVLRLMPGSALGKPGWRMARLAAAGALVGVAVGGPRWGAERSVVRSRGIDMVLALDASLSMLAQDERPSRLE